jgi:hypothetical protein
LTEKLRTAILLIESAVWIWSQFSAWPDMRLSWQRKGRRRKPSGYELKTIFKLLSKCQLSFEIDTEKRNSRPGSDRNVIWEGEPAHHNDRTLVLDGKIMNS